MKKNLCDLCQENKLPFKARRLHWARNSYVLVIDYEKSNDENFKVYGSIPKYRKKYIENCEKEIIEIRNSNVHAWEVIKNGK